MIQVLLELALWLFDKQLMHFCPPRLIVLQVLLFGVVRRQKFLNNLVSWNTYPLQGLKLLQTGRWIVPKYYCEKFAYLWNSMKPAPKLFPFMTLQV